MLQAVDVVSPRLGEILARQGFKQTTVKIGKETVDAVQKVYEVK